MSQIKVERDLDGIAGLCRITPTLHGDARGYFTETYSQRDMAEAGFDYVFVQDNQSMSVKGVLRGLHFQKKFPQTKLVRVISGAVFDVAVDLREGSPTWGKNVAVDLTQEGGEQLFIPRGFAHGFVVLSDVAQFQYKVDNVYAPQAEMTVCFDDPDLGIDWRINPEEMLLSEKDKRGIRLNKVKSLEF